MSITRLALRFAAPVPRPESFERVLFVGPHPDDIEIGAGATAAKLAFLGKKVSFLICLDGRYGLDCAPAGTTPEELISLREAEARASAKALGVEDVHFLRLSDGDFYTMEQLQCGVAQIIGQTQPQLIFAPDPDVTSECHADHRNVGEAVRRIGFFAPFAEIMAKLGAERAPVEALAFYMTAHPNRFVQTRGLLSKQLEALACHKTQFPEGSADLKTISLYLRLRAVDFGLRTLKGEAEGFRVLSRTRMHCLPEAGL